MAYLMSLAVDSINTEASRIVINCHGEIGGADTEANINAVVNSVFASLGNLNYWARGADKKIINRVVKINKRATEEMLPPPNIEGMFVIKLGGEFQQVGGDNENVGGGHQKLG